MAKLLLLTLLAVSLLSCTDPERKPDAEELRLGVVLASDSTFVHEEKAPIVKLDTLVLSNSYYGSRQTYRFIVGGASYWKLARACQMWMIPYNGLNFSARAEFDSLKKYIIAVETIREESQ